MNIMGSLYGLKQAPRAWFQWFASYATIASSAAFLQRVISSLHAEFSMTDLGSLNYFLGISAKRLSFYMYDPYKPHLATLKRILRYVRGTLDHGLQLHVTTTTQLTAYTDADWAGCPITRCVEAEYRGVANVVTKTAWIRSLLRELHTPLFTATLVYYDNDTKKYLRRSHAELDNHED
ncbi:ribonuclease H-like domain-containing protein [Tanacetum coccineum]